MHGQPARLDALLRDRVRDEPLGEGGALTSRRVPRIPTARVSCPRPRYGQPMLAWGRLTRCWQRGSCAKRSAAGASLAAPSPPGGCSAMY